jgi:MoxR-like ATPase
MSTTADDPKQLIASFRRDFDELRQEICSIVLGQDDVVTATLIALVAGGHVLVEGVPGLGKTLLAKTLADALTLDFRRIQFTPDLMPADVIGTYVVLESQGRRRFEFQQGPIFANLLLADEINRATPKTQSALLEGLSEGAVTVSNQSYELPKPFFTIATQSPSDEDGTFPLPATQLDRFLFKLVMPLPSRESLDAILERATSVTKPHANKLFGGERILEMSQLARRVTAAPDVRTFALDTMLATHPQTSGAPEIVQRYVAAGASPRGAQAMILAGKIRAILEGRVNVSIDDVTWAAKPALRHRIALNFEGHAERINPDDIIAAALAGGKSH